MVNFEDVYKCLEKNEISFAAGVPDSLLNDFCSFLDEKFDFDNHILTANEGNAIAVASGYYLSTGKIPLVYMQNSGIGNSINPIISLTHKDVFNIPMILLIGWRGNPEIHDWAQHKKQGKATLPLLDILDIPYKILEDDTSKVVEGFEWAKKTAYNKGKTVALVAKKNVFSKKEKTYRKLDELTDFTRYQAISLIIDSLPSNTIYVASTGRITREIYYIREEKKQLHDHDFLNVGSMGHALSISLGLALNNKNRLVVCLDGDAASIMHMGSMAIATQKNPKNLIHIVLNNGVHESVGGQKSVGADLNFNSIASSIGYDVLSKPIRNSNNLKKVLQSNNDFDNVKFLEIKIIPGMLKNLPPLDVDHINLKEIFMKNLLSKKGEI